MLRGQCLCGSVRYSIAAPFQYAGYCHCARCRASTGSAFCAFGGVESEHLRVIADSLPRHDGPPP